MPGRRQSWSHNSVLFSLFMYKYIVSCYYWPTTALGLRLRSLVIKEQFGRLTPLDRLASSIERRKMRGLRAKCEVELVADLSFLDNDVQGSNSSLIFLGRTHDVSAGGMAMVLPSTTIDERFCSGSNRLNLSLHVPDGVINMEVSPVRCERLNGPYFGQGYLLGTRITKVGDRAQFDRYLDTLSGANHRLHR